MHIVWSIDRCLQLALFCLFCLGVKCLSVYGRVGLYDVIIVITSCFTVGVLLVL